MQRFTLSAVAALLLPGFTAAQAAKVESQVLVVGEPGLQYSISPAGQHLAAVVLRGSRQVLVHDGVDGPRFDQILPIPEVLGGFNKMTWSDDGSRYAYYGRVGQEYVVIVDGKEVSRGPWSAELAGQGQTPVWRLGFTPGGKHWYLIIQTRDQYRQHWQLVIDGKPGPVSDSSVEPLFSQDGEHHAYILQRNPTTGQRSSALILDGKPTPYQAGEPQFTADGLHLFTKRMIPSAGATEVLADGAPFMRGASIQLHMAPVGPGVLGVVWTPFVNSVRSTFLTVGNRKVPGSDCTASAGLDAVYISADGKHYAARCPSAWMLVDGKKGMEYPEGLSNLAFTADGRAVYQAKSNGKTFMIVGDQESDGYVSILPELVRTRAQQRTINFQPAPAIIRGNTVAYVARLSQIDQRTVVVVNGKAFPATNAVEVSLSPDGSRHAFMSGHPYQSVSLDGVAIPGMTNDPSLAGIGFQDNFKWSPDSKHIAWAAVGEGRTRTGVAIDGKFFPTAVAPRFLRDGRHLVWLTRGQPGHLIFVDGEPGLELPQNLPLENEADIYWSMGQDGVITLVAQDGESIKRFRITPGTSTSVETLLAKAK